MRTLEEILNDIREVKEKMAVLLNEKANRLFFDFCEKYGVRRGDIVETQSHERFLIEDIDRQYLMFIRCHKIKKNGKPYANTSCVSMDDFKNCEIIKGEWQQLNLTQI